MALCPPNKIQNKTGKAAILVSVSLHVPWVWFHLVHKQTEEGHEKEITMIWYDGLIN